MAPENTTETKIDNGVAKIDNENALKPFVPSVIGNLVMTLNNNEYIPVVIHLNNGISILCPPGI